MTIAEDLREVLSADGDISALVGAGVSARIHFNVVPQKSDSPTIWFSRGGHEQPLTLDGVGGVKQERFDLECASTDPEQAIDLADKVTTLLHGKRGSFNNSTAQGVFVEDQDGNYLPKSNAADEGIHVEALNVMIWYTT